MKLVNKILSPDQADKILTSLSKYPQIKLESVEQKKDVRNIATGVYSPITGFLKQKDFESVVENMQLTNGEIFPIPVVLDIDSKTKKLVEGKKKVVLLDPKGIPFALLSSPEIYSFDKTNFAEKVFGTRDQMHPGVEAVFDLKKYLIGGEIELLLDDKEIFPEHNFTPEETRRIFKGRGWKKIVAFQTRNVPHRGHEFLQKEALKQVDGLFVQPVIGEKKIQDFKDEYIIAAYERLIDKHYPINKVLLGVLPLKMRYAGPREALFHAVIRRNYGCTHFIVGRDHAGVGNYYGPYDAQKIFDQFEKKKLGIEIMTFKEVVLSKSQKKHMFVDQTDADDVISFSGTKMRSFISEKKQPPEYILRPEVYEVLVARKNVLVDDFYKQFQHRRYLPQKGFVLWFTGLSQSGKSTIAERLYEVLEDKGINCETLDGDVVRESLSSDLGFTKKDRDENIKRVGFVAKLLARNNVVTICSFISPYKAQRNMVRRKVNGFIEIFTNTPLEVCEARDQKGFYKMARAGEIDNFTGISAPYEAPENPEIELKPHKMGVDECVNRIIEYLEENRYLVKR